MKSSNRSSFLAVVAGPLLLALASFPVVDGVCNTYEQDVSDSYYIDYSVLLSLSCAFERHTHSPSPG